MRRISGGKQFFCFRCVLAFFFLFSSGLSAEESPAAGTEEGLVCPITLEEAIVLALNGNLELKQQQLELSYREKEALSSWNAFLPDISLSGGLRNSHGFGPSAASGTDVTLSGGISLTLAAGIAETLQQAKIARSSALVSYAQAELDLIRDVKTRFYALLSDKENLVLLEESLQLARSQEDFVRRNYQNGLASELEYLRSRYAAASIEPQLTNARRLYRQAIRDFCLLLGIPEETRLDPADRLEPVLPEVRLPADTQALIDRRGDVMLAVLAVENAESELSASCWNRFGPSVSFHENLSVGDFTAPRDLSGNGSFSVSVSIPLGGYIPGSQQALASERSRVNLEQAKIALENTRTAAGQEVLSLFNTIQDITETFAINRMNETFAARAYELSRAGFDAGLVSQTDLEIARQDFLSARYTVIAAVTQYRSSLAELAHALNVSEEALWAENTTTGRGNAE